MTHAPSYIAMAALFLSLFLPARKRP